MYYNSKVDNQYPSGQSPGPYGPQYDHRSDGSCCLRCCCCCCCFIIFSSITIGILVMFLFNTYDPMIPEYKIESLEVKTFQMLPNSTLNTEMMMNVKINNPNKRIGYYYGEDGYIQILYMNHNLCEGKLPSFHQVHETSTTLNILLKGTMPFSPEMQKEFEKSKQARMIPVDVNVKVPASIILGEAVRLREFKIYVYCHMTLDNLSPNGTCGILSKDTRFRFEL